MKLPTFYLSHGGGPCFWMEWDPPSLFDKLGASLKSIPEKVGSKPKAILCISAHWEEEDFTVQTAAHPSMLYDYSGFPPHTYELKYPAPGSPELAARVKELIIAAGFKTDENSKRGFDHGLFVPFMMIYPDADFPIIQLSIRHDYDPKAHFEMGRALAPLREEGVLIVGSGYSYHNLRNFFRQSPDTAKASLEFDQWLNETLCNTKSSDRYEKLLAWESAPSARACHPQEDHLVPLFVAAGAAEDEKGFRIYSEKMLKFEIQSSSFQFGET